MDMRIVSPRMGLVSVVSIVAFTSAAHAQTGPDLLLGQFGEGNNFVGQAEAIFQNSGHTNHTDSAGDDDSGQLFIYNARARFKLDLDNVIPGFSKTQPRAGFQATVLDFHSSDPAVPDTLTDMSFGVGIGIAKSEKWVAGVSVGIGYASANVFSDSNALYGKADIAVAYDLNDREKIGVVLDYNRNRTFMPDVPLPGFIYTRKLSDQFTLEVGFPYSDIQWQPDDQWTLMFKFVFPDGGQASVDYKITQTWHAFAAFTQQNEAFHWDALENSDDRVLFHQTRAELGMRAVLEDRYSFVAAVGYSFNTELEVGWDTRDSDELADLSDEPYVRFGVEVKF